MIDGDESERLAIDAVWPRITARVCQFHMMQACKSKLLSIFGTDPEGKRRVRLALKAIRACQRCPIEGEWPAYIKHLQRKVANIAGASHAERAWAGLESYLLRTWFSERWRRYSVDYAMPGSFFREGPWSTNNYVKVCFRIFDRVMLEGRANKRLDRLILIIIQVFFPYFENLPFNEPRPSPDLVRQIYTGLDIWQSDNVEEVHAGDQALPGLLRHGLERAFVVRAPTHARINCGRLLNGRWYCLCHYFSQTGKRCSHLWAAQTLDLCGLVTSFDTEVRVIEIALDRQERQPLVAQSNAQIQPEMAPLDHPDMCEDDDEFWSEVYDEDITAPVHPANPRSAVINTLAHQDDRHRADDHRHQVSSRRTLGLRQRRHPAADSVSRAGQERCKDSTGGFRELTPTPIGDPIAFATGNCKHPTSIGDHSYAGRPPAITAKQPNRAKRFCQSQASTIGRSLKKVAKGERAPFTPVGVYNTGTDCYALSLFQLFVCSEHLRKPILRMPTGASGPDTPSQLLRRFVQASNQAVIGKYPEIRHTLDGRFTRRAITMDSD